MDIQERPGQAVDLDEVQSFGEARSTKNNVHGARCSQVGDEHKCILDTRDGWMLVDNLDEVDMHGGEEDRVVVDEPGFQSTDKTWNFDVNSGSVPASLRGAQCRVIDHSRKTTATDRRTLECEVN